MGLGPYGSSRGDFELGPSVDIGGCLILSHHHPCRGGPVRLGWGTLSVVWDVDPMQIIVDVSRVTFYLHLGD